MKPCEFRSEGMCSGLCKHIGKVICHHGYTDDWEKKGKDEESTGKWYVDARTCNDLVVLSNGKECKQYTPDDIVKFEEQLEDFSKLCQENIELKNAYDLLTWSAERSREHAMRARHTDRYFETHKEALNDFVMWLRENPYPKHEETAPQNPVCNQVIKLAEQLTCECGPTCPLYKYMGDLPCEDTMDVPNSCRDRVIKWASE